MWWESITFWLAGLLFCVSHSCAMLTLIRYKLNSRVCVALRTLSAFLHLTVAFSFSRTKLFYYWNFIICLNTWNFSLSFSWLFSSTFILFMNCILNCLGIKLNF